MPPLRIREAAAGEDWIVAPTGDLDIASAEELDARLTEAAREHPEGLLIVDLSGLEFMDSAGLRVLLSAARSSTNGGSRLRLRLRGARRSVQRVFEVSGTDALLPFE
jgi:anti-sigma B factor antagonist